eukprot:TRINITY_DN6333_c0_g1_i1.p1 TRINITY_DN6333_c0_g1~~TRINITY_DN6333_c0_g1_i1.p1  ORF type:complete len:430 (-),score=94.11 TRINITY_DN6333_c0_g1_i1:114-1403(-)
MDWPLSKEEQKKQVLKLYDRDVRAANDLLQSGEAALNALRAELRQVRTSRGTSGKKACMTSSSAEGSADTSGEDCAILEVRNVMSQPKHPGSPRLTCRGSPTSVADCLALAKITAASPEGLDNEEAAEAAQKLQLAIVDAAAALAALLGTNSIPAALPGIEAVTDQGGPEKDDGHAGYSLDLRQRARSEGAARAPPALVQGERRRRSRGGERLRVSFAGDDSKEAAVHSHKLSPLSRSLPESKSECKMLKSPESSSTGWKCEGVLDEPDPQPEMSDDEFTPAKSRPEAKRLNSESERSDEEASVAHSSSVTRNLLEGLQSPRPQRSAGTLLSVSRTSPDGGGQISSRRHTSSTTASSTDAQHRQRLPIGKGSDFQRCLSAEKLQNTMRDEPTSRRPVSARSSRRSAIPGTAPAQTASAAARPSHTFDFL